MPVAGRPEIVQVRQPHDAEIDPRREEQRDENRRELREAQERLTPQRGRDRPDRDEHRREAADPQRRRGEVHPVGDLRLPRRARVDGVVAREREAAREPECERERGHEEGRRSIRQPGEVDERGDEREPERHRDECRAEARSAGDRREVAVQELAERELQRVLRAQQERDDADLEHAGHADRAEGVQPLLDARRQHDPAQAEQTEPE